MSHATPDAGHPRAEAQEGQLTRRQMRAAERAAEARTATQGTPTVPTPETALPSFAAASPSLDISRQALRQAASEAAAALTVQRAAAIPADSPVRLTRGAAQSRDLMRTASSAAGPSGSGPARRPHLVRRIARRVSVGASLLFIGSLVVVTSLPAQAVQDPSGMDPLVAQVETGEQVLAGDANAVTQLLAREDISVNDEQESSKISESELASLQAVADAETPGSSYGGNPAFPKVWPMLQTSFVQSPVPSMSEIPVTSGFGARSGGSHGGTDFKPGLGKELVPIANGVVSEVFQGNNPGGGGYTVFIDHNIDGQFVQSWYAHMLPGSIRVKVGQVVDTSTVIGQVGNSGRSTGPHLHLELKQQDYVSFDPVLWFQTRQMRLEYRKRRAQRA